MARHPATAQPLAGDRTSRALGTGGGTAAPAAASSAPVAPPSVRAVGEMLAYDLLVSYEPRLKPLLLEMNLNAYEQLQALRELVRGGEFDSLGEAVGELYRVMQSQRPQPLTARPRRGRV